jgi:hypothetical protein
MIQIQDVKIPTKGVAKYLSVSLLNPPLSDVSPVFRWALHSELIIPADESDEQPTKTAGAVLMDGDLEMEESEYALWESDESYAIEWVLNELNLTKI